MLNSNFVPTCSALSTCCIYHVAYTILYTIYHFPYRKQNTVFKHNYGFLSTKNYLSRNFCRKIYMGWKLYHWMQLRILIIIIYFYIACYKTSEEKFEKYLQTYKNQQKIFHHVSYHQKLCYWGNNWQFSFAIYFLILFLHMNSIIIASFITTKDKLNLLNYDRRHIQLISWAMTSA